MRTLSIVICDDDRTSLDLSSRLIEDYFNELNFNIEVKSFTDGNSCLAYLDCHQVDLAIFDIFLENGQMGTQLAIQMRLHNKKTRLIFLSTSNEFATESFAVDASYYIIKPLTKEKLSRAIERCGFMTQNSTLVIDIGSSLLKLDMDKVIALEVQDKYTYIHTVDQTIKERCAISKLQEYFHEPDFLMIHRSFIINLNHVARLDGQDFIMSNGYRAPMRSRGSKAIKDCYMQWLFDHM